MIIIYIGEFANNFCAIVDFIQKLNVSSAGDFAVLWVERLFVTVTAVCAVTEVLTEAGCADEPRNDARSVLQERGIS